MLKYDLEGNYLYGWGTPGGDYGHFNGPDSITTDQDGNLYIAEVFNGRIPEVRASAWCLPSQDRGTAAPRLELRPTKAGRSGGFPMIRSPSTGCGTREVHGHSQSP